MRSTHIKDDQFIRRQLFRWQRKGLTKSLSNDVVGLLAFLARLPFLDYVFRDRLARVT